MGVFSYLDYNSLGIVMGVLANFNYDSLIIVIINSYNGCDYNSQGIVMNWHQSYVTYVSNDMYCFLITGKWCRYILVHRIPHSFSYSLGIVKS